jgi:AraC family transcriptional regulator
MEWLIRMRDALDLIESRMEEPIEMNELARAACSSPFHFQRMFHMLTGTTVAEYIRKRRLTLAAQELASSSAKVIDVALKYGYETPEAFAKAFRRVHGIPPSAARSPGTALKAFPRLSFHLSLKGDKDMEYRIVEKGPFGIIGKSIEVPCKDGENKKRIPLFWQEVDQDGTIGRLFDAGSGKELLGVCADFCHEQSTLTYWVALEGDAQAAAAHGFESRTIPAATWAVFPSVGPMPDAIQKVWGRIYQEWFPGTGYEHAGGPELEVYFEGDSASEDYKCEVWIPVVRK